MGVDVVFYVVGWVWAAGQLTSPDTRLMGAGVDVGTALYTAHRLAGTAGTWGAGLRSTHGVLKSGQFSPDGSDSV